MCPNEFLKLSKQSVACAQLERERERKKEKVDNREILSCLERKCPVENVPTFYMWRESLQKRENPCETFSLFLYLHILANLSIHHLAKDTHAGGHYSFVPGTTVPQAI
jgi:hypothetical protein